MTAPTTTTNGSAYPRDVEDLLPEARKLPLRDGEKMPSRNRLMREFRIGAPKADAIREVLMREGIYAELDAAKQAGQLIGFGIHPDAEPGSERTIDEQVHADVYREEAERDGHTRAEQLRTALILRGSLLTPETDREAVDDEPTDPWEHAAPVADLDAEQLDALGIVDEPGSDEPDGRATRPRRRWFRRNRKPLVISDGHPGTKIASDPVPSPVEYVDDQPDTGRTSRRQLLRIRWAVRAVLALGVAASIAGNVLHARDELISQIISAWSPLALLLTIELISRVPVHRRHLALARWAATTMIAGIAAWVSYWHMAAVASHYGETNGSQYLLPLSVDGLVVVASICLVELGGRIAAANSGAKR